MFSSLYQTRRITKTSCDRAMREVLETDELIIKLRDKRGNVQTFDAIMGMKEAKWNLDEATQRAIPHIRRLDALRQEHERL